MHVSRKVNRVGTFLFIMKKTFYTFASILLFSMVGKAQYNDFKLDVGGLIFTNYGFGYEYGINDEMGINARIGYFSSGSLVETDNDYNAFTITTDFRYYFNPDEGCDGNFVSGYLKFRSVDSENFYSWIDPISNELISGDYSSNGLGLGITYGRKWVTRSGFMFETYSGVGRYLINSESELPEDYPDFFGDVAALDIPWDFRIGLIVGWRLY